MTNINDLRKLLLNTLMDLKAGKISANDANAISKSAQTIINLTKLQLEYYSEFAPNESADIKFLDISNEEK